MLLLLLFLVSVISSANTVTFSKSLRSSVVTLSVWGAVFVSEGESLSADWRSKEDSRGNYGLYCYFFFIYLYSTFLALLSNELSSAHELLLESEVSFVGKPCLISCVLLNRPRRVWYIACRILTIISQLLWRMQTMPPTLPFAIEPTLARIMKPRGWQPFKANETAKLKWKFIFGKKWTLILTDR